ncbi:polyphenol oxidase family protein [Pengzhenrongella sicca]|uniref:Laccase domain-containing protein n=1 Tax=Pengzhenrongella sicca TaxID=2819238 RepID=A0A8A4ZGY8_9MICO|nr:polyphenol oxidase family protein [Pengzhenrongella sicca]QTE30661.1 laccase domain-containing protein [Pengzhenrongella sicca]
MRTPVPVVEIDLGAGVRAGFTTRAGGVSAGPYASLNLGLNVADDERDVATNRALVGGWAGGPLTFATQVHGAAIAVVPAGVGPDAAPARHVDGLVAGPGVAVGVLVADCVPVLLADSGGRAVAAVHAGRAGLASGVVQAAVAALGAAGVPAGRIRAAIGPAICGACYEVPAELRAAVAGVVPAVWATTSWGTPALDLPAGVAAVLAAAGVRDVQRVDACTRTDLRFYSHRRAQANGATTGRFAGVIRATGRVPGVSDRRSS